MSTQLSQLEDTSTETNNIIDVSKLELDTNILESLFELVVKSKYPTPNLHSIEREINSAIACYIAQQHTASSLLYASKKPRIDVLRKLKMIDEALSRFDWHPFFTREHLKEIIKTVLGARDERTLTKYTECIINSSTSSACGYLGSYDITLFSRLLQKELSA